MAYGILGSSKGALLFAGGVVACAAIVAASMGSQFTPQSGSAETEQSEAAATRKAPARVAQQPDTSGSDTFGDFAGFADESELLDDTSGMDTSPNTDDAVILNDSSDAPSGAANNSANGGSSDDGDDDGGFAPAPSTSATKSARNGQRAGGAVESNKMKTPRSRLIPPGKPNKLKPI